MMTLGVVAGLLAPWIGALVGAVITVAFMRRRRPRCMCGHHYGVHDPNDGSCAAQHTARINNTDTWVGCACLRYVGPNPTAHYYVQPLPSDDHVVRMTDDNT